MQEGPFLGSHREEVTYLEQRFNDLVAGESLKPIVLLEAPSGYGKSRIVREFYSKLADSQKYWPDLPSPASDPMSLRKVIGPDMADFVWEAGALPTFTWWSFNCEELASGGALDVIGAARSQWEDHRVPVAMAVDNIHSRGASKARWKQRGTAAMNRVFSESASLATDALIEAAGLTFPGARALLDWGRDAMDAVSEHQHRENQLHSRVDLGGESAQRRHAEATSFAEVVRDVTRPELPTVIVVEDIHLMTPELAEFLNRVTAEPVLPVLVVATAWPGTAGRPVYAQWRADADGLIETRTVQGLTQQQRERLVSVHAPGTPRETCAAIAAQHLAAATGAGADGQRRSRRGRHAHRCRAAAQPGQWPHCERDAAGQAHPVLTALPTGRRLGTGQPLRRLPGPVPATVARASPREEHAVGDQPPHPTSGTRSARALSSRRACSSASRSEKSALYACSSSEGRMRCSCALSCAIWSPTLVSCRRESTESM